jgi:hypothetical protein
VFGQSDFALHRPIQPYGCAIDVRFVTSTFKIEPLNDWEWGLRAAARLMRHHRLFAIPLTLVALVFGHVLPAQVDGLINVSLSFALPGRDYLDPQDFTDALINSAMMITMVTIYLKAAGVVTSWRAMAIGLFVILALEFAAYVVYWIMRTGMEVLEHSAAQGLIYLAMIALVITYLNYTFCLATQILVDGKLSLARSYKGVARREWRLWSSHLLIFAVAFLIWGPNSGTELIGEQFPQVQALMPYLESGLNAFVWALLFMATAALSTIWFLHPRVRPSEESTTWEVSTIAQPS